MEQMGEDFPLGSRRPLREQMVLHAGTGKASTLEQSVELYSRPRVVGAKAERSATLTQSRRIWRSSQREAVLMRASNGRCARPLTTRGAGCKSVVSFLLQPPSPRCNRLERVRYNYHEAEANPPPLSPAVRRRLRQLPAPRPPCAPDERHGRVPHLVGRRTRRRHHSLVLPERKSHRRLAESILLSVYHTTQSARPVKTPDRSHSAV
ncbi:uncharacterized protein LOC144159683 isoform X2 [Haemaphysalis longicornis]